MLQLQDIAALPVIKGADRHRTQIESRGLQADILGSMTGIHMHILNAPLTIFPGGFFIDGRNNKAERTIFYCFLTKSGTGQILPQVPFPGYCKLMFSGFVMINPGIKSINIADNCLIFEWKERSGGWSGTKAFG